MPLDADGRRAAPSATVADRARPRRSPTPRPACTTSSTRTWPRPPACTPSSRASTCAASPLIAFGGAGPVHACGVAELLESPRVIFPVNASVLSAFGTLVTPVRIDLARSLVRRLDGVDATERDARARRAARPRAGAVLAAAGVPGEADPLPLRRSTPATRARATRSRSGSARASDWPVDAAAVVAERFDEEYAADLRPDHPGRRRSRSSRGGCRRTPRRRAVAARADLAASRRGGRATATGRSASTRAERRSTTPVYRRDALGAGDRVRRAGDRRGAGDDHGHPPGLVGRGRRRRLARRHAGGGRAVTVAPSTPSSSRCCGRA